MSAPDPLYVQVADSLRQEVERMGANAILPSEQRLARRFRVSRITLRLALSVLERSGLVTRARGRGTIVNPPKVERHIIPVSTLEQDVRDQGRKLETTVLRYERAVTPPPHIRARLGLGRTEKAGLLWLIREVDDRIVCHDERYFPPTLAARFNPEFVPQQPVTDILQDLARRDIAESRWETEIAPARRDVAEALQVGRGTLVLTNTFTERFDGGEVADTGVMSYRIDRVKFLFAASGTSLALGPVRRR